MMKLNTLAQILKQFLIKNKKKILQQIHNLIKIVRKYVQY